MIGADEMKSIGSFEFKTIWLAMLVTKGVQAMQHSTHGSDDRRSHPVDDFIATPDGSICGISGVDDL